VPTPFASVDDLCAVLDDDGHGVDTYSALDHHLQCADILRHEGADVEMQIAGLVHDVASSLDPRPSGDHAEIGAALVRPLLGDRVADLVAGHVPAKRYLVTTEPSYRDVLSGGSTATLALQGDALTAEEVQAFAASPLADDWLALRRADDRAKVVGLVVPDLASWRPTLDDLAARTRLTAAQR
jgi:predicted HD phosphohydrolase